MDLAITPIEYAILAIVAIGIALLVEGIKQAGELRYPGCWDKGKPGGALLRLLPLLLGALAGLVPALFPSIMQALAVRILVGVCLGGFCDSIYGIGKGMLAARAAKIAKPDEPAQ